MTDKPEGGRNRDLKSKGDKGERVAARKSALVWGFIALVVAERAEGKIVVETRVSCRCDFEFSEVEAYARTVLASSPGQYYPFVIMEEGRRAKGCAGTFEIDGWWCRTSAVRRPGTSG